MQVTRLLALLFGCFLFSTCSRPEDPARTALRDRLKQTPQLSDVELVRLRDVIRATMKGKTFVKDGAAESQLTEEERRVTFGMLTEAAGLYDEGLRQHEGATFRILNAPGLSANSEIEAFRRLWVDVETFLPRRFEFAYAFPGFGDYSYDLAVE
jgi:hypothetical protein